MHPTTTQKDRFINANVGIIKMYGSGYIRVPITQKSHTDNSSNKKSTSQKNQPKK
jgi:hypothetical protein